MKCPWRKFYAPGTFSGPKFWRAGSNPLTKWSWGKGGDLLCKLQFTSLLKKKYSYFFKNSFWSFRLKHAQGEIKTKETELKKTETAYKKDNDAYQTASKSIEKLEVRFLNYWTYSIDKHWILSCAMITRYWHHMFSLHSRLTQWHL